MNNSASSARIRLQKVVYSFGGFSGKIARKLQKEYLDPILAELENEIELLTDIVGDRVVHEIQTLIASSSPSGAIYEIWEVASGGGKGAYTHIDTIQASAAGQPPGTITGTLLESISYEVLDNGIVKVGLYKTTGNELETLFFVGKDPRKSGADGKIFVGTKNSGSKTKATKYGTILDLGMNRPWWKDPMDALKPKLRKIVRKRMQLAIKRASRKSSKKGKFYIRVYFNQ